MAFWVIYAERHKEAHYAECRYGECRYAECRGALNLGYKQGPLGMLCTGLLLILKRT
jgi:hypothetical protein